MLCDFLGIVNVVYSNRYDVGSYVGSFEPNDDDSYIHTLSDGGRRLQVFCDCCVITQIVVQFQSFNTCYHGSHGLDHLQGSNSNHSSLRGKRTWSMAKRNTTDPTIILLVFKI